ncbi:MAG TPA: phosphatase PAP2 family protein [Novosphingobium sp.]|nr:phosphatase PAP2 family protein [Novosphingobium sp.]
MLSVRFLARAVALVSLGAVAGSIVAAEERAVPSGYLAPDAFDLLAVLPPAPMPDDPRGQADRAIFRKTRALQGTPRWDMATSDVESGPADMMRDFSCAVGVSLTPANAPRTAALIRRAGSDTGRGTGRAKTFFKRQRPFLIDDGVICQPREEVADSYDYPSGHTTAGWTWAMLLARLAPDRATQVLARGRAYGESRIVCGVHNASAVEAGRLSATATLTAMEDVPAFRGDLAAARKEMDGLRADAAVPRPDAAQCGREARLVAMPVL